MTYAAVNRSQSPNGFLDYLSEIGANVVGGAIGGAIATVIGAVCLDRYSRRHEPVLNGVIDVVGVPAPVLRKKLNNEGKQHFANHIRLRVYNTGIQAAKQCRVMLVGIDKRDSGNPWERQPFDDAIEMTWAYGSRDKSVVKELVVSGVNYYVDVCRAESETNVLEVMMVHSAPAYRELVNSPGTYRFRFAITAENAQTTLAYAVVVWSGRAESISGAAA